MEEDLAIVILPSYLGVQDQGYKKNQEDEPNSGHTKTTTQLMDDLAIVILPDYLEQTDEIEQQLPIPTREYERKQNKKIRHPVPPPPRKKSNRTKQVNNSPNNDKINEDSWLKSQLRPLRSHPIEPLPSWLGNALLGRKRYKNFMFSLIFVIFMLLAINIIIGPVDGTGGNIAFDGNRPAYSPLNSDIIEQGEIYPCDPQIQRSGCRNSLTPFFAKSDSMPHGLYLDSIIAGVFLFIALIATFFVSNKLHQTYKGTPIESSTGFNPNHPNFGKKSNQTIERMEYVRFVLKLFAPVMILLLMAHLLFMQIPGEGMMTKYDGLDSIKHPDSPGLTLQQGDIYPCDSTIQISSCDMVIRPTLGVDWIVPAGFYPTHLVILVLLTICLIIPLVLDVELKRAALFDQYFMRHKIGLNSGNLGVTFYEDLLKNDKHPTKIQHLNNPKRGERFGDFLINGMYKFVWWLLGRLFRIKSKQKGIKPFNPLRCRHFYPLPRQLSPQITYDHLFPRTREEKVRYRKVIDLGNQRLYPFRKLTAQRFKSMLLPSIFKWRRKKISRPSIQLFVQPRAIKPAIQNYNPQKPNTNFGNASQYVIPYHFIHTDKRNSEQYQSKTYEEKTVLFVHNPYDYKIIDKISKMR